jgi:hypothetical protein
MEEILDPLPVDTTEPLYLRRSAHLFKLYGILLVFTVGVSFVVPALAGLAFLVIIVLAPVGLFFSWKTYMRKEGTARIRLVHLVGHMLLSTAIAVITGITIRDLLQLF